PTGGGPPHPDGDDHHRRPAGGCDVLRAGRLHPDAHHGHVLTAAAAAAPLRLPPRDGLAPGGTARERFLMRWAWLVLVQVAVLAWLVGPVAAAAQEPGGPAPPRAAVEQKGAAEKQEGAGKAGQGASHEKAEADNPFAGAIDLTIWSIVVFLLL